MRLLFAQHLDPSLRLNLENIFKRDLKEEIITMTRVSIKSSLRFYSDIHLYCDKESEKHYNDLPITLHELKITPEFFCGAKLEVLEDQKDLEILVEGHTDTDKMKSKSHPVDNWELSVLRATSVVKIMLANSKMDPTTVSASGRSQFAPIDLDNKSKNRRIEVVLIPKLDELFEIINN